MNCRYGILFIDFVDNKNIAGFDKFISEIPEEKLYSRELIQKFKVTREILNEMMIHNKDMSLQDFDNKVLEEERHLVGADIKGEIMNRIFISNILGGINGSGSFNSANNENKQNVNSCSLQ
jgi:hypothetical protein